MIGWLILGFITIQRLSELLLAKRNTEKLLREGASEYFPAHYPLIVILHVSWLLALYLHLAFAQAITIQWIFLGLFGLLTFMRIWVLITLGPYFTTRIISLKYKPLVKTGPYRLMKHPNYIVVAGEIFCVPLIFGWWKMALVWGSINLILLWHRIRCENRALSFRL